jgi:hypothetical protein
MAEGAMSTPLALRSVYYMAELSVTIAIYLWTRSGGLQLLAFVLFCVVVVPLLDRFLMPRAAAAAARDTADYKPSRRVITTWLLLSVAWFLVATLVVPDLGLGPVVGILVVIIPVLEVYCWLGKREHRSVGAETVASN